MIDTSYNVVWLAYDYSLITFVYTLYRLLATGICCGYQQWLGFIPSFHIQLSTFYSVLVHIVGWIVPNNSRWPLSTTSEVVYFVDFNID